MDRPQSEEDFQDAESRDFNREERQTKDASEGHPSKDYDYFEVQADELKDPHGDGKPPEFITNQGKEHGHDQHEGSVCQKPVSEEDK